MVKQQHLFPLWWQTKSKIPGQVTAQKTTTCSVRVFKSIFPACVHHGFCFQIKLAERAWKPWNCLYLFSGLCDLQPGVHHYGIHQQGVRISQRWETNMMCWVNTQRIQIQVTKRHKPDTVSMHTGFFFLWLTIYGRACMCEKTKSAHSYTYQLGDLHMVGVRWMACPWFPKQ